MSAKERIEQGIGIPLTNDTVGVWALMLPDSDWMAGIWMEDGTVRMAYRFRYYVDDKTFDSEDAKHWYAIDSDDTSPDKMVEMMREIGNKMAASAGNDLYELMMADFDDEHAFMEEFQKAPFIDTQKEMVH